nr:hypothetical protein [Tanacetum cinerariifolium]
MDLLHNLLDTCTTLTRRVENLEYDKIAQDLEITKLKQRVKQLEKRNKLKVSKLRRLKRVGTAQRVKTSDDTVMDDVSKQGRIIANMDADIDVTLKDIAKDVAINAEIKESADVQGRQAESQAQIYQINFEHADKVLSMQDDKVEPVKLKEVTEVVITVKLITEVVTAASATITDAAPQLTIAVAPTLTTAPGAARRRKGAVIRDSEETATPSTIIHSEAKSKDKGKGILAELNKNIDWDEVIDHVHRKEKEDNAVKSYQALERKPQTEAQARKNMMIYLRNVDGFKMDYFMGMTYDDICPIFEKKFNSNKLDEEVEELRKHLQIVPNEDDDVYTKATPLVLKVPVVDFEIYTENNKPYYKIKRADERKYPLIRFTLEQMLNNVRLEVEEENEVSLELLSQSRRDLPRNTPLDRLEVIEIVDIEKVAVRSSLRVPNNKCALIESRANEIHQKSH